MDFVKRDTQPSIKLNTEIGYSESYKPGKEPVMTKEDWKAKKRANRRLKRQQEHRDRVIKEHEDFVAKLEERQDDEEWFGKRNPIHGKKDLTAYYGILNSERPKASRVYGVIK